MNAGKELIIGFNRYEICTINNEDYVKLKDVPNIVGQLYARRLVEFSKAAVEGVSFRYDPKENTLEIMEGER